MRIMMNLIGGFLLFVILPCGTTESNAGKAEQQALFNVGYQVLDLKYQKNGQEQTITVAVWYPTAAQPGLHNYGGPTKGSVALGAMPLAESAPYPLLVFSHGYGGSGLSAVFLTEALAAHGWVVACPDHHDKYSAVRIKTGREKDLDRKGFLQSAKEIVNSNPENREKYLYRLDEMRAVLDGILASGPFGKLIDKSRVAAGGHSFGGFTALGVSGTIKEYYAPRVKAILLFSTGAGAYLFRDEELAAVQIPSMLFMGEREEKQVRGSKTMQELSNRIFNNLPLPKYFLTVKGANHFSFNDRLTDIPRIIPLSGTEEQFEVIRKYSIAFLEKYIAGKQTQDKILENSDPMLTHYLMEPGLNKK